jgi:hypothetical protein
MESCLELVLVASVGGCSRQYLSRVAKQDGFVDAVKPLFWSYDPLPGQSVGDGQPKPRAAEGNHMIAKTLA